MLNNTVNTINKENISRYFKNFILAGEPIAAVEFLLEEYAKGNDLNDPNHIVKWFEAKVKEVSKDIAKNQWKLFYPIKLCENIAKKTLEIYNGEKQIELCHALNAIGITLFANNYLEQLLMLEEQQAQQSLKQPSAQGKNFLSKLKATFFNASGFNRDEVFGERNENKPKLSSLLLAYNQQEDVSHNVDNQQTRARHYRQCFVTKLLTDSGKHLYIFDPLLQQKQIIPFNYQTYAHYMSNGKYLWEFNQNSFTYFRLGDMKKMGEGVVKVELPEEKDYIEYLSCLTPSGNIVLLQRTLFEGGNNSSTPFDWLTVFNPEGVLIKQIPKYFGVMYNAYIQAISENQILFLNHFRRADPTGINCLDFSQEQATVSALSRENHETCFHMLGERVLSGNREGFITSYTWQNNQLRQDNHKQVCEERIIAINILDEERFIIVTDSSKLIMLDVNNLSELTRSIYEQKLKEEDCRKIMTKYNEPLLRVDKMVKLVEKNILLTYQSYDISAFCVDNVEILVCQGHQISPMGKIFLKVPDEEPGFSDISISAYNNRLD